MRIAIIGEMRSGKDTVGKLLMKDRDYRHINFADGIREVISVYFPDVWKSGEKPRKHYQVIGQSFRQLDPNFWVNVLARKVYYNFAGGIEDILITDVRQENEVNWCRENGFILIKVLAPKDVRIQRMKECGDKFDEKDLEHETEQYSKKVVPDHVIYNYSTYEDLVLEVEHLREELGMCD